MSAAFTENTSWPVQAEKTAFASNDKNRKA
jgi:hypothetical protein